MSDVLETTIALARDAAARPDGTGLEHFLQESSAYQAEHLGCLPKLWITDHHLVQTARELIAGLLADAQAHGRVRLDLRSTDISLALWSIRGVLETTGPNAPEAWKRHLDLLIAGMRPTDAELAQRPLSQNQVDRFLSRHEASAAKSAAGEPMTTLQDTDAGTADKATARAHLWILVIIAGAQLMVVLDTTIMIIALPSAQHALGFSNTDRQWVVTAYTLAFGGFLLLGGRISDMVGPKRTLMIGVAGFALASAVGGAVADHAHADRRPRAAGPLRRAAGAVGALDPHLDLLRPEGAGARLRDLRHHRHRRVRLRAHPRRLPDPVRRLALVPLREPAHCGTGPPRCLPADPHASGHPRHPAGRARRRPRVRRPGRPGVRARRGRRQRLGRHRRRSRPWSSPACSSARSSCGRARAPIRSSRCASCATGTGPARSSRSCWPSPGCSGPSCSSPTCSRPSTTSRRSRPASPSSR